MNFHCEETNPIKEKEISLERNENEEREYG